MQISIVIPTFNEEEVVAATLKKTIQNSSSYVKEIIISDGGSTDKTKELASQFADVRVVNSPVKRRSSQMNYGAKFAQGDVLFFLHADTIPPIDFDKKIIDEIKRGAQSGCFRLTFDWKHPMLNFYGWCTKFDLDAFRFGDQGLFISREIFRQLGGYREDHFLMEDNEIVRRVKKDYSFKIMADNVITSARKYKENGAVRLEFIFLLVYALYHLGISQKTLRNLHQELIN